VEVDGGSTPGGTALGGDCGLRSKTTAATMANNTTAATVMAAIQASLRWRLRRAVVAMFLAMFLCQQHRSVHRKCSARKRWAVALCAGTVRGLSERYVCRAARRPF
jgi:hypothetical protein